MKSINARFKNEQRKHPFWSTFNCFASAISGQHFSYRIIKNWFNILVDKDDYDERDKRELLKSLRRL